MAEFDTLAAYMEHVSLVMDVERQETDDKVSLMTLHSAKGLEFPLVFLPGWEDGSFPSQKSMDELGLAGLEEERRLAYVGLTRARERAMIYFAANRQIYGSWQSSVPSRFIDELPSAHVEARSETGYYDGGGSNSFGARSAVSERFAASFDAAQATRSSPGFDRYKANKNKSYGRAPRDIEGHAVRRPSKNAGENYKTGERVFHQKFGYGKVTSADGTKLTVAFDKAGSKKVLDGFVTRA
jgi:DNA helicase-2/ATP-dependent DNA helicase PcrA